MISKILEIANKFIPDKDAKLAFEKEMKELEIKEQESRGNYIEKVSKAIPLVMPAFLFALLVMFCVTFGIDVIYTILGLEAPIIHISAELIEICKLFMSLLLGKKCVEKFAPKGK